MQPSLPQLQEILANRSLEAESIKSDIAKAKELVESCETRLNKLMGVPPIEEQGKFKPLREFIRDALNQSNEPLTVKEITELVLEAGYKTNSNGNFPTIVQQTIYNDAVIKRKTKPKSRPVRYALNDE
jgi:hypothetical protein